MQKRCRGNYGIQVVSRSRRLQHPPGPPGRGRITKTYRMGELDVHALRIVDPSARVVAAGDPLIVVGEIERLEVVIEMLSTEAVRLRPGMPATLEGWGGDQPLRARVRVVEPFAYTKVSALGVEEQRTRVKLDFVDAPGALGDGFRVTARVETGREDGVAIIPSSALFRCGAQWCVVVLEGGAPVAR